MEIVFDTHGNDKQKRVAQLWADKETTVIVYGGSKMSGKSYLGCSLIFSHAFMYPGTQWFIARKNLNDLRKYTTPSVMEVFKHWGVDEKQWSYNGQDNYFLLKNGSRVYFLDAKYLPADPMYMRFGSMQMTGGWIEEGGEFSLDAKNNLQASIGRWMNDKYKLAPKLLITCNPAHNFLYTDFYRRHKEGTLEPWNAFIQALPSDNKMMTPEYYANLERSLTAAQKQRLLFGNWEFDDSPDWLIDYEAACDLFSNEHIQPTTDKYLTADIAMKGRDMFIGFSWQGRVGTLDIEQPYSEGPDVETAVRKTQELRGIARSKTIADSDGVGSFLSGYLKGIVEFHGNAKAFKSKEFMNLKCECAYKLAEYIMDRKLRIICSKEVEEKIKEELTCLRSTDVDNDMGKRRIISKDEMKKIIGRSPDYLDNLIMRMYFECGKSSSTGMRKIRFKNY